MGEKIIVGPVNRALRTDVTPFMIDNDSFPKLINAYQWRGRVKRKRGTTLLGRLQRNIQSSIVGNFIYNNGVVNLLTIAGGTGGASIVPGSLINFGYNSQIFTEPSPPDGTLSGSGGATGTINYSTGIVTLSNAVAGPFPGSGSFNYYPVLPVMGLEDLSLNSAQFPGTLAFDTTYSYNIPTNTFPYTPYDVSFYKNPPASASLPGYTPKGTWTRVNWNGNDYQQFWTTNYEGALWTTNGIDTSPTTLSKIGMQFKPIVTVTVLAGGPPAIVNLQIIGHSLVVGDFVFINEVLTTNGINFQTGYVINVIDGNNVQVEFPNATIAGNGTGGIAQYLTNTAIIGKDCLRWYDGDPTNGLNPPTFVQGNGWINFCPPLSQSSFSIAETPSAQYYLVGARLIFPFKDRILFFGPVIQTSSGSPIYLQDTVIYSQNGTPYYTSSFTGSVSLATTVFNSILVPNNQTATANAYFEDVTGFGGFLSAGLNQPILTVGNNEDVLVVGFSNVQTKLVYTQNDIVPFNFYLTNAELGSASTFSSIIMDKGVIVKGNRGYLIADQTGARRIDLEVIDLVFETSLINNGSDRVCAQRDYINEWIYFTYPSNQVSYVYPNQTLLYNYRDDSWAIFNECYTTYGQFRPSSGLTWNTAPIWNTWHDPWDSGSNTLLQPQVIAGNQQGFIVFREDETTSEATSLYIQSISGNTITSPNHCLNNGDYVFITGCLGTVSSSINNQIFQVSQATTNTFFVSAPPTLSGTYLGGGLITRLYIPFIQTKQFPVSWGMSRKTRIGPQQYLFTTTNNAQIQLLIFLSQNSSSSYNIGPIVPDIGSPNNSLIYNTVLYTCPESTNLGLTPANINLQMVTAAQQEQTWHRMNTSLLGDTVQIGFTLSDEQMRAVDANGNFISQDAEIELHSFILDCSPSQVLA